MMRCFLLSSAVHVLLLSLAVVNGEPTSSVDLLSSSARFGGGRHMRHVRRTTSSVESQPPRAEAPLPRVDDTALSATQPIGRVITRAIAVICAVIAVQCAGAHDALPGFVRSALSAWQATRARHPLALATACAFALYASSDALSQCVAERDGAGVRLDWRRLARTGCTAAVLSGFLAVFYFRSLEGLERAFSPLLSIFAKIGIDVGVYEPVYDTLYISLQALLRGEAPSRDGVREKVLRVWRMAPRYWLIADLLTFGLMPLRLRPMSNALLSIPWGMYISSVANQARSRDERAQP